MSSSCIVVSLVMQFCPKLKQRDSLLALVILQEISVWRYYKYLLIDRFGRSMDASARIYMYASANAFRVSWLVAEKYLPGSDMHPRRPFLDAWVRMCCCNCLPALQPNMPK